MEAGAIHWMMFLKGIWIKCPSFKDFWTNSLGFPFLSRKCKFYPFSWNYSHEPPMAPVCVLSSVENQKYLWSSIALRSPGKPPAVTSLVTVLSQGWKLLAPREGQWKGEGIPAIQLLSSQPKPQMKMDLCWCVRQGFGAAEARTCPTSHPWSRGAALVWGKAESATFNSLSSWPLSGA